MLWFFERDGESLELETRYDNDTSEFVVSVLYSDGYEESERFTDGDAYGAWLDTFERNLETNGWTRRGEPMITPNGWPNEPLM